MLLYPVDHFLDKELWEIGFLKDKQASTAHDGGAAVDAATEYHPDVVLLDIGLPGLDGYEVARRIRQQPILKDIVLVALTGYGQDTDRQRSAQAGFNRHLVKPARFEQLHEILREVAEKVRSDIAK